MAPIGMNWNPAQVMVGQPSRAGAPYLGGGGTPWPGPMPTRPEPTAPGVEPGRVFPGSPPTGVLGPESIRATGKGPFDPAYRQNLATYAGGQFQRPGGQMNFNPTDPSTFPGMATGGGTAPVPGMPMSLLGAALGGNPFSWIPPVQPPSPGSGIRGPRFPDWLEEFLRGGRFQRMMM